jgi:hypothetical protein
MDIHKPKPWHGLREFLKEYVIIVVGVLTALAGEQIVETLHRHEEVEQARAALKVEVARDVTSATLGARNDACLAKALTLWEAYATGGPKPALVLGNTGGLSATTWEVARSGAVANMPLEERVAFANFYSEVGNQMSLVQVHRDFARRLAGYARLPKLTPQEADDLLRELPGMEGMLGAKVRNYTALIEMGRSLGAKPEPNLAEGATLRKGFFSDQVDKVCALAATAKAGDGGQQP